MPRRHPDNDPEIIEWRRYFASRNLPTGAAWPWAWSVIEGEGDEHPRIVRIKKTWRRRTR